MSLTRQFFRELRPFFRLLDEPIHRASPAPFGALRTLDRLTHDPHQRLFDDPFFAGATLRPALDVHERADAYVVEAELPGVRRQDVAVRVADGGRTPTIEGRVASRASAQAPHGASPASEPAGSNSTGGVTEQSATTGTALATERAFSASARFTRTVVLPSPVDPAGVSAKLTDGVLTLVVPKVADAGSVSIPIE